MTSYTQTRAVTSVEASSPKIKKSCFLRINCQSTLRHPTKFQQTIFKLLRRLGRYR
uniref:Uncharacterized protein n=1 Tax=Ciona intestinalis TaxID=7719 RepID=H2Y0X1_CIOIN